MPIPTEGDVPLRHVAIDGPIGVGKTSLVQLLARKFHGTQALEDVDNPFLPEFYKRKKGAAFQTQLFFLLSRYQQQREIAQIDLFSNLVVADYHFPKDKIFACLNLDDSELLIYDRLYNLLSESVPKPDLVIYLQGSLETCMKRVKKASRSFEKGITPEYVAQLIEAYNYYFYHYEETPLLVVDTNEIDFVNRTADFEDLVAQIQKAKKGVQYYVPAGSPKSSGKWFRALSTGKVAIPPRAQSEPASIVSQRSRSSTTFASRFSLATIRSTTSTARVEPIRQGVHLPHDSMAQNSSAYRAIAAMSTVSSKATMPP